MQLPLDVSNVQVVNATQVEAVVKFAGQAAQNITIDLATQQVAGECPILDLHIDPIHLNLLGLHVDTSAICVEVSSIAHEGLGDLLCDLTGTLDLNQINVGQLDQLLDGIEGILDGVLGGTLDVTGVGSSGNALAAAFAQEHSCNILNLSVGAIDLELLGISVEVNNCEEVPGPVTIDITGHPNGPEGGLLGQVLCGIADGLNLPNVNLGGLIDRVGDVIDRLTVLADRLTDLPDAGKQVQRLERQIDRLERFAERVDTVTGLDRIVHQLDKVIDQVDKMVTKAAK